MQKVSAAEKLLARLELSNHDLEGFPSCLDALLLKLVLLFSHVVDFVVKLGDDQVLISAQICELIDLRGCLTTQVTSLLRFNKLPDEVLDTTKQLVLISV